MPTGIGVRTRASDGADDTGTFRQMMTYSSAFTAVDARASAARALVHGRGRKLMVLTNTSESDWTE
jgi:hypothetical protein